MWLIGMIFLITSSLLGSVNFIVTIVQLRTKGLTWMRLPFFVWAQFVTSFLLLLAFPPLEAAGVMQLMDRVAGTSFFMPSGLVVSNQVVTTMTGISSGAVRSGGGNPLLWQHLFLVPRPPGGLRADPPGDGHRRRGACQQHPEAAVGISGPGLLGEFSRRDVVHRLGAPHVHDRHGHDDERLPSRLRR